MQASDCDDTGVNQVVIGLVLAGGRGRRVGGRDKGLINWQGKPLAARVCERLRPQVDALWLSCNRNAELYRPLADRLLHDALTEYQGPLAGIASAAPELDSVLLLVSPCDLPLLPGNLAARLCEPLRLRRELEATWAFDGTRDHYLPSAYRSSSLSGLARYLEQGGRSMQGWLASLQAERVDFSDRPQSFFNVNRAPA